MEKPKIAVFTRMHYKNDIPESNLFCFENYYLPALKNQSYQDFDIIIISNDNEINNNRIRAILNKSGINKQVIFTSVKHRIRFQHEIEINIDSDDGVDKDHIKRIVDIYYNYNYKIDNILVVVKKYIKLNVVTNERYICPEPTKANNGFPTNFYAVIQRGEKTIGCGERSHNKMDEVIKDIVVIDNIWSTICIHENNHGTTLHFTDKKIQ